MLKVKMIKTSHAYEGPDNINSHAKYETFKSCEELLEFMKKTHDMWVVNFDLDRGESEEYFDFLIELYDCYRE